MAKRMSGEYWTGGSDRETPTEEKIKASARARAMFGREPNLKGVPAKYQDLYLATHAEFLAV